MANGSGLIGNMSTTQSAIIVRQPGNSTIYYVFTLDEGTASNQGAYYSVVDMSLAAGMGSVTTKNSFLFGPNIEKQIAVRHCNGKDVWIVNHEANNNNFRAYLLTAGGLNPTPVISSAGNVYYGIGSTSAGEMKASPDGTKIGLAIPSPGPSSPVLPYGFDLYDFDASTGTVSNPLTLLTTDQAYGVEFSPDGTKLYGTRRIITSAPTSTLCQWDICSTNTAAIISSLYTTTASSKFSAIQRGIDNKLYLVNVGTTSMSVIHNPNNAGSAMNFVPNSLSLGTGGCGQGLPNYVTGYTKPQNPQITSTINCQQGLFNAPSYTFANGCTTLPYPVNGYLWDFGDSASGAANTSTLANTGHDFTNLGTYTVSLIVFSNCENDTIRKIINVTNLSPTVSVAGTFTICKNDKRVYTVSGGSSYAWSNGSTSFTVALNPTLTTVYTASATLNGCTQAKSFTVTVNPCNSIDSRFKIQDSKLRIYPNPANEILNVEFVGVIQKLKVVNALGQVVKESETIDQNAEIKIDDLPEGIYILSLRSGEESFTKRFVVDR
jgi:hypothetical protein